jgi:hypothetical protein
MALHSFLSPNITIINYNCNNTTAEISSVNSVTMSKYSDTSANE